MSSTGSRCDFKFFFMVLAGQLPEVLARSGLQAALRTKEWRCCLWALDSRVLCQEALSPPAVLQKPQSSLQGIFPIWSHGPVGPSHTERGTSGPAQEPRAWQCLLSPVCGFWCLTTNILRGKRGAYWALGLRDDILISWNRTRGSCILQPHSRV